MKQAGSQPNVPVTGDCLKTLPITLKDIRVSLIYCIFLQGLNRQ